jgi:hypothetical protein
MMTQDEIIELATQVGMYGLVEGGLIEEFKAFAKLVADKEREACAKLIESHGPTLANGFMLTEAIRARGQE